MKYPHSSKTVGGIVDGQGTPSRRLNTDTPSSASLFGNAESARMAQWGNLVARNLPNRPLGVNFISPWGRSVSTSCWSPATTITGNRIATNNQLEEEVEQPNDDTATTDDEERRLRIYSALQAALLIRGARQGETRGSGLLEHRQSPSLGGD